MSLAPTLRRRCRSESSPLRQMAPRCRNFIASCEKLSTARSEAFGSVCSTDPIVTDLTRLLTRSPKDGNIVFRSVACRIIRSRGAVGAAAKSTGRSMWLTLALAIVEHSAPGSYRSPGRPIKYWGSPPMPSYSKTLWPCSISHVVCHSR
jgi:hypothetical protein